MIDPNSFPYFLMEMIKVWLPTAFYLVAIVFMIKKLWRKK